MPDIISELKFQTIATQPIVSYSYAYEGGFGTYKRTERWTVDINPVSRGFYGYGYGTPSGFQSISPVVPASLDYFSVLGLSGTSLGYGIDGTQGIATGSYQFGFGYEFANAVVADNEETIQIVATVSENGVPQAGINVLFRGSAGTTLSQNTAVTDVNGQVFTDAKISSEALNLKILENSNLGPYQTSLESLPLSGYFSVRAIIDERPEDDEGKKMIETSSNNLFIADSQSILTFESYAYNHYGYGYNRFI